MKTNFWQNPDRAGIKSPKELRKLATEYFDWADQARLLEAKPFAFQGSSWIEEVEKARAFTLRGLSVFLGISSGRLAKLREDERYNDVFEWIDDVIWTQKFELAAADLLNAGLISRDLGLADKRQIEGGMIVHIDRSDADL